MKLYKTETGLEVKIEIECSRGFAGWIEVSKNRWIDCRWDLTGKCLIENELGSFYNLLL